MKKTLLTNLKYIAFGLVFAFGVSAVAQWAAPSADPYAGNKAIPVHVGPAQIKSGGLSVQDFLVSQNSSFEQALSLRGVVRGGTPADTNSTVAVGNTASGVVGNIAVNGNILANSYIQNQRVANDSNKALCADVNGVINLCVPDMCRNIDGNQETVPSGHTRNSKTGNCTEVVVQQKEYYSHNIISGGWEFFTTNNYNPNLGTFPLTISNPSIDTIPTSTPSFLGGSGNTQIFGIEESGIYNIRFLSSGYMTVYDKNDTAFQLWVDFYVNINGVETRLTPPGTFSEGIFSPTPYWSSDNNNYHHSDSNNIGAYFFHHCNNNLERIDTLNPIPGYNAANYTCDHTNWGNTFSNIKRGPRTTLPYKIEYQKYGVSLNSGDTIRFYGKARGRAGRERTLGNLADEYVNFLISTATILHITKE